MQNDRDYNKDGAVDDEQEQVYDDFYSNHHNLENNKNNNNKQEKHISNQEIEHYREPEIMINMNQYY